MSRGGVSIFVTSALALLAVFATFSALRLLVFWTDPGGELQNHDRGPWGQVFTISLFSTLIQKKDSRLFPL